MAVCLKGNANVVGSNAAPHIGAKKKAGGRFSQTASGMQDHQLPELGFGQQLRNPDPT